MSEETNLPLVQELISQVKAKNKVEKLLTPTESELASDYRRGYAAGIAFAEQNLDEALEEWRQK
jgi:hypothetical protein